MILKNRHDKISHNIDTAQLAKWVKKAKDGDKSALEEVIKLTSDYVYYYCLVMLNDEQNALDAVQDIFIVVIQKLDTVKNPRAFLGWLKMVTSNYCTNKVTRKTEYIISSDDENNILEDFEDFDDQKIPEERIDNEETSNMLMGIIKKLPEAQRECILMYYYQDMSIAEISTAVGISEGTVKSRLNYARKTIKKGVEEFEEKGFKLYGLTPIPFIAYFLTNTAAALSAPIQAESVIAAAETAAISSIAVDATVLTSAVAATGIAAGSLFGTVLSTKIAAGAMAVALLAGGGIIGFTSLEKDKEQPAKMVLPKISTADTAKRKSSGKLVKKKKKHISVATADTAVRKKAPQKTYKSAAKNKATEYTEEKNDKGFEVYQESINENTTEITEVYEPTPSTQPVTISTEPTLPLPRETASQQTYHIYNYR